MTRKRPLKIIIFSAVLLLVLCNACQRYNDENDFTAVVHDEKTVEITGYTGSSKDIRIPPRVNGLPVTVIGKEAFQYKKITSVTIPNSVTHIGKHAFRGNELTSVIIPDSVTHIGEEAFYNNKLTDIRIPKGMTVIGDYVFEKNKLTSVIIPNNITHIGIGTFLDNELASVIIPDSVIHIGRGAFMKNQLTEIIIPENITAIENNVFRENKLTSITIPENIVSIGQRAFLDNEFTEITIPKNVISIGEGAFYIDYSRIYRNIITKITICENVELGENAFSGFTSFYNEAVLKRGGTYIYSNYHWIPEDKTIPVYRFESGSDNKFSDINFFADMPDLEYVSISYNEKLTDITPLSGLKKLKELHIYDCLWIENLEPLSALTNLEILSIGKCEKIKNLRPLSSLTNLKNLSLRHYNNYDYSALAPLRQLEELSLVIWEIDVIYLNNIGQLRFLKKFTIRNYPTRYQEQKITNVNALQNMINLERLEISNIDNLNLSFFSSLRNLKELKLKSCPINDLSPLANLPNLVNVNLTDTETRDITPLLNSYSIKSVEIITYDFDRYIEDDILSQFARKNIQLNFFSVDTVK
jgi:hypothetical protein